MLQKGKPLSSETQTEQAYRKIEDEIITLGFRPGSMLSEGEIRSKFNIGRTPIREALLRLEREGLVEIYARRGVQVTPIDVFQQLRLHEVRRPLSQLLVKCASLRATSEERKFLLKLADDIEASGKENDGLKFIRGTNKLQSTLVLATQNDILINVLGLIHGMSRRFWYAHYKKFGDLKEPSMLHANIARAVASGDQKLAEKNVSRLMAFLEKFHKSVVNEKMVR